MKTKLLAILVAVIALAGAARADGILIPGPWPPPTPIVDIPPSFAVKYHHVDVKIEGQIARTHIDQVFISDYDRDIEATYIFPIPEGATIKEFNMWSGKEKLKGKILDAAEARRIYEAIVRHRKDPALLEYMGRGLFKASVYPVPAHGEKRIEIEYTESLEKSNNVVRYSYPLNTERFSSRPLQNVTVSIDIHSPIAIKNVYSPTHNVSVRQTGNNNAVVSYEENNTLPNIDFTVYYTQSDDNVGLGLITYKPHNEDGYFLFMASPSSGDLRREVEAKDVVFVFDRTGSMSGEKIQQAREALKFCLNALNPGDRFNLVTFNETPDPLFSSLVKADKENVNKALEAADSLDAMGGTDINSALKKSLPMLGGGKRPSFVIFLTDGLPTVGEQDIDTILKNSKSSAPANVRMFSFGVGYDVNTTLLDGLAKQHRGMSEYVRPAEDIEVKVSTLFRSISFPVLANLEIAYGGMKTYDIFPGELPDLFKGGQIIVAGRFRGGGTANITLSGQADNKIQKFNLSQNVDGYTPLSDFVPILWAQRKIGFLVSEIRQKGQKKELVDEVIRLSKKYGIITEYTSFLVEEPEVALSSAPGVLNDRFMEKNAAKVTSSTGGSAVNQSMNMQLMMDSSAPADISRQGYFDSDGRQVTVQQVRNAGNRTLFQSGENWIENTYTKEQKVTNIKAYSPAYFQLLERDPSLGQVMSVGPQVLFTVNGNAIQIADSGLESLSAADMKNIFGK